MGYLKFNYCGFVKQNYSCHIHRWSAMFLRKISLIFIVLVPFYCQCKVIATTYLKQLSIEQGLNQSHVTRLMQDNEGFMWIGTLQGLNFYDGYTVKPVSDPNKILQIQQIETIYQDHNKEIWVSSFPNSNIRINKTLGTFTAIELPFPEKYDVVDSAIVSIIADNHNSLWLSTYHAIFYQGPNKNISFKYDLYPSIGNNEIIRATLNYDDKLLIGTSVGLYTIDKESGDITQIQFLTDEQTKLNANQENDKFNVKGLHLNKEGKLLILTVEGLYQINPEALKLTDKIQNGVLKLDSITIEAQRNIWHLIEHENFYWLATDQGLFKHTKKGIQSHIIKYSDTPWQIIDDNIHHMIEDFEGNFWLSSRNNGAFWWSPQKADIRYYQQTDKQNALSNNTVWSVREDSQNNLWVGTENGINRISADKDTITQFNVSNAKNLRYSKTDVSDIEINDNKVWVMTDGGIKRFDAISNKEEPLLLAPDITTIFNEPGYDLYFTTPKNMLFINEKGMFNFNIETQELKTTEYNTPQQNYKSKIQRILGHNPYNDDEIYMSMIDQIVIYSISSGTTKILHQLPPSDKPRTPSEGVFNDGKRTWISYSGFGIYIIDNQTGKELKHITSEDGLPDNTPYQFLQSKDGFIWTTSNSGLARISPENYHIRVYDTSHGLSSNEFNSNASHVAKNGDFLLSGIKGMMRFDPLAFVEKNKQLAAHNHITKVDLLSRPLHKRYAAYYDHQIELNHNDFGLTLEFSALQYANTNKLKYKYWLEGDSPTPPTVISTNQLLLPKLSTGSSTFKVSVIDYETGLESPAEQLKIKVHPAPYLSWWALTCYTVIILLIIISFYWQNKRKRMALLEAHATLKTNEERLLLSLKGSDSGLWDWDALTNEVFETLIDDHSEGDHTLFEQRLALIHEDDRQNYLQAWNKFIKSPDSVFEAVYRMKLKEKWIWFRDLARITKRDENEKPIRVTGTYTDINQTKEDQDKISLFSDAFQSTRDLVVITDQELNIIDVNQAFYTMTLYQAEQVIGVCPRFIHNDAEQTNTLLNQIVLNLKTNGHWEGEGYITRADGNKLAVLINTTKFVGSDKSIRFVFAITDISKQKEAEAGLKKLANYDSLTDLPNRALLHDRIKHAIEQSQRNKTQFAICFIDLDKFKLINDTLGHDVGDELLVEVADILKQTIRQVDTVARIGGDEFILVIENLKNLDPVYRIAQRIIESMANMDVSQKYQISSSPSIGVATFPSDGHSAHELLKSADIAMYHAKEQGRNNFQFFEVSMNQSAHEKLILETEIKHAIEHNHFTLAYQPKIDLHLGIINGVEALARWTKPDGTPIAPHVFIPVIEDLGLIIPLTEQLIHQALAELEKWQANGYFCSMAINLSAKHLQNYDLPGFIKQVLNQYKLLPNSLELELTEGVLMDDIEAGLAVCRQINDLDVHIALDDFGTGYSSFKYLSQLPIDTLKIDRSFIWKIGDPQNEAIISSIVSLANTLGIKTVAEGVETEEQLAFLQKLNCDWAQGFYFAKPLTSEELQQVLPNQFLSPKHQDVNYDI